MALITVYDMGKAINKEIRIEHIQLEGQRGSKRGVWQRDITAAKVKT